MITVINLKIGNVASVTRSLQRLGFSCEATDDHWALKKAEKIILPGVGSFKEAMQRLRSSGLSDILKERVLKEKVPLLGICLGMQLLASSGEEGGSSEGLGIIKGRVVYHRAKQLGLRLPHIGWNDVTAEGEGIFSAIPQGSCFYFVHSYEMLPEEAVSLAHSNYGVDFTAAVRKENIWGVQFHPEKSQEHGLRLLKNFCEGRA